MTRRADVLTRARAEGRPLTKAEYKTLTKPKPATEHNEQCKLVEWVLDHIYTHPPLRSFFAVPNAGGIDASGSRRGAFLRGARMKAEGAAPGYPDTGLDVARGGWFGLRIEMKRSADFEYAKGEPSDLQSDWHTREADEGYCMLIAWGWEPARDALLWYLSLLPTSGLLRAGVARWEQVTPPTIRGIRWIHP